jgi:hypothetical protein
MGCQLERNGLHVDSSQEGLVDTWTQDLQQLRCLLRLDFSILWRSEERTFCVSTVNDFVGVFYLV